jgi:N6-L-threonylcarbamoyladenine synthase
LLVEKMDMFGPDATGGLPVADMAQAEENAVGTAAPTNPKEKVVANYRLTEIGGSLDLHAGQFVDRAGVALGLDFPAGPALEKLAEQHTEIMEIPVSVHKTNVSFSGPCTAVIRRIKAGDVPPAVIAASVQWGLAETFLRMIRNAAAEHNVKQVILAGGVSSNLWIRKHMETKLAKRNIRIWVPESSYSGDNAAGCAAYAYRQGERHG